METHYVKVAQVAEVPPGSTRRFSPGRGHHIVVCNVGGKFYAIRDVCTHDGGILGLGELDDTLIECPRHGAKFDVTSGKAVVPPAVRPVTTYSVRVRGDDIEVAL